MKTWEILFLSCIFMVQTATARVKVIDGDSLVVDGKEFRLQGIDAPEYEQECYDKDDNPYKCGVLAYLALQKLAKQDTKCEIIEKDRYKRYVGICESGGEDVAYKMVMQGWAVAYTQYAEDYVDAEKEAKSQKNGIWQGRFMKPELYRALIR